ncbi:MAG: DUF2163 domain-containing protein [Burkholderiaceae bacterium]
MRAAGAALLAHYAQGSTTLARCWKCLRADGQVFGFTSVDIDIEFEGVTYKAATGFTPSAMEGKLDMSVPNLEVQGFLDSASITESDLLGGKWDNCEVEIFEVNYRDLTQGRMILATGKTGNVSAGRVGFIVELRGLLQTLQQPVGGYYTKTCPANFGDSKCGYNVEALRVSGTVSGVTNRAVFATALGQAADYFGAGVLTWTAGPNNGLKMEISAFTAGLFTLNAAMPFNIAVGDAFTVVPGCRKRRTEDCKTRWANVVNFRGFPDTPLNDKVLGSAGVTKT